MPDGDNNGVLDARQVRTRAKLQGAMLALLAEEPFERITVRAIAEAAQVGYATFFRHYPDKGALLHDLADDEITELLGRAAPLFTADDTRGSCVALIAYVAERRALWRALLTGGAAPILRERLVDQSRVLALKLGGPPSESRSPLELRVTYSTSAVLEIIAWWLREGEAMPIEEIAAILDRLVIRPTLAEG